MSHTPTPVTRPVSARSSITERVILPRTKSPSPAPVDEPGEDLDNATALHLISLRDHPSITPAEREAMARNSDPTEDYLCLRLPEPGSGHNTGLMRVANLLVNHFRVSEEDATAHLESIYQRDPKDVRRTIEKAMRGKADGPTAPKFPPLDPRLVAAAVPNARTVADLRAASPGPLDTPAHEVVRLLMRGAGEDPLVCVGANKKDFITKPLSLASGRLGRLPLIVPQPMTAPEGMTQDGHMSPKSNANTGPRQNVVVEFDGPPKDTQAGLVVFLSEFAPLLCVCDSGGKSLHGYFDVANRPESEQRRFMWVACLLGADKALWTLSQFARIPGGTRPAEDAHDGKPATPATRQELLYFNPDAPGSLWRIDDLETWVESCLEGEDGETPVPAFPLQCLPPVAGDMAREMARVTTAQNEPLAVAAILGTLSASIGAGLEVHTGGGRTVRGNIFILAVAESGTGKGENFTHAAAPLFDAEGEAVRLWETMDKPGIAAELAVTEKRVKLHCEAAAKATDAQTEIDAMNQHKIAAARVVELTRRLESSPRYRVADVTKEALAIAMQGQPGEAVASMSSEARGIFSIVKGRYGKEGGDEDFYCSGYSGDSLTVDRVGRPRVTLRRPCLSILWMVQPDAAQKAFADPSLMESGMIPRFLMFDPKAEPKERFDHHAPIAEPVKNAWENLIRDLLQTYRNNGSDPCDVEVAAEATAEFDEFERETVRCRQKAGDLSDVAAFVARWNENAWRLALVLHAARHGADAHTATLEPDTARAAIVIVRWFAARQLEMLRSGRREGLKKDLLALLALLANGRGAISFSELRRSHSLEDKKIRELHRISPNSFNIERRESQGRPSWVVTAASPHSKIKEKAVTLEK
jgi:hypothetical protein